MTFKTLLRVQLLLEIIFTTTLYAGDGLSSFVTKVYSRHCERPDLDYRGSGILIKMSDDSSERFVLTSEHVLLQGRKENGICHKIGLTDKNQGVDQGEVKKYNAELVSSDWQAGLALLKIVDINAEKIPAKTIDQVISDFVDSSSEFFVNGFPYADTEEVLQSPGRLESQKSLRHLMPNGRSVFEVRGALGEFGMSGGPVFSQGRTLEGASELKMIGMLSHQYLFQRNGPAAVGVFNSDEQGSTESHLLVLKGGDVKDWIKSAINENFKAGFVRDSADQMNGEDVVYSDGLKFKALPQESTCSAGDPVGVGGDYTAGDPVGVGGADPVGVGGGGSNLPKSIIVEITKDRNQSSRVTSTKWNMPKLDSWIKGVRESLSRSETITSPALIYRPEDSVGVTMVCTKSLEEYFRKLVAGGTSALTYRKGGATSVNHSALVLELKEKSSQVKKSSQDIKLSVANKKLKLLEYVSFYSQLTSNVDSWMLVVEKDVKPLLCVVESSCPFASDWSYLFEKHSQESTSMLQGLRGMSEVLRKLKVGGEK